MSALRTPLKISGTGYLVDAESLILAHCSDGQPCEEIQEVIRRCNLHTELVVALETFKAWAERNAMWDKTDQCYYKACTALAKARN